MKIVAIILLSFAIVITVTTIAFAQCGKASYYNLAGQKTASGEIMKPNQMGSAHRTLPFGSKVKVTDQNNGKTVVVVVKDRGPFVKGRIIDLYQGAAEKLGMIDKGVIKVCIEVM